MSEADSTISEGEDEEADLSDYSPDPQSLWAAEAARAMLVVLSRRLGPDFARDVHNEIYARTIAYEEGCPDDRRDGASLEFLLTSPFWDNLFDQRRGS